MGVRQGSALALLLAGAALAIGCGTGAVDVDGCRQIEEARCQQAPACGVTLAVPTFTSGTDVDACIRFYDDACLHGLVAADPGPTAVAACVAAVQNSAAKNHCSIVNSPQTDAVACGWLVPPASAAADASDAPQAVHATSAADASSE
jgi:hypothetical protein